MTVSAITIKEMFPEFANKSDSFVDIFINNSKTMICQSMYGNRYDLALSYLTAHFMKISSDLGRGEVTSEKVGDLSRSYAGNTSFDNGYSTTPYGRQFIAIRRSLINKRMRPIYGNDS